MQYKVRNGALGLVTNGQLKLPWGSVLRLANFASDHG
jgi:hypothetical protein